MAHKCDCPRCGARLEHIRVLESLLNSERERRKCIEAEIMKRSGDKFFATLTDTICNIIEDDEA